MLRPKKHVDSFGFQCVVANICGGDVAWVAWIKCENPGALPPFLAWEGVLATEAGDLGIMEGEDNTSYAMHSSSDLDPII